MSQARGTSRSSSATLTVNGGNQLDVQLHMANHSAPPEICDALMKLGWDVWGVDGDTGEQVFEKVDVSLVMRWYEAMAYEFWRFMNIGTD